MPGGLGISTLQANSARSSAFGNRDSFEGRACISSMKGGKMGIHRSFLLVLTAAAIVLAQAVLIHRPIQAQTVSTGAITGIVTDPSGAAIAGVTVEATEKATGSKRATQTDANGSYRFSLLPLGPY